MMAVNIEKRLVLDGTETVPITNLIDADGDECGPADAIVAVAGPTAEGKWLSIDLREFDPVEAH